MPVNIASTKTISMECDHSLNLIKFASKNREQGYFNDVVIVVDDDVTISANKMILASHSFYFEKMFKTDKEKKRVEIQSVKGKAVKMIIDFFYMNSLRINGNNVLDLLDAAQYLQLRKIQKLCFDFLEMVITPEISLALLKIAGVYDNSSDFANSVHEFIAINLDDVVQTNDYKSLSKKEFLRVIYKCKPNIASESSIFRALTSWINHNPKERERYYTKLFQQLITLSQLSVDELEDVVLQEPLVVENTICHQQVLVHFSKSLKAQKATLMQLHQQNKVIRVGGGPKYLGVCDIFSWLDKPLLKYPDLSQFLSSSSSLLIQNTMFCIGGKVILDGVHEEASNEVSQLNLSDNSLTWKNGASMNKKRYGMGATVHQNKLVVVGGSDGESGVTNSAEFYPPARRKWELISPMKEHRYGSALVSCEDGLYALGGSDSSGEKLSSVELLRSLSGTWKSAKPMQVQRTKLAAVYCDGIIYAIGGKTDHDTVLSSVEQFYPPDNAWSFVEGMQYERYGHSACVLRGKIYVFGGWGDTGFAVLEIECYDPINDLWTTVGEIDHALIGHSIVAT